MVTSTEKSNQVVDAISRKNKEVIAAMLVVETTGQVRELAKIDLDYKKFVGRISEELICKYWLDDGLVHVSGGWLYIPTCRLR